MSTTLEYGNVSTARYPNPNRKRKPSTAKGTNPTRKKTKEKEKNEALVIPNMAPIGLDAIKKNGMVCLGEMPDHDDPAVVVETLWFNSVFKIAQKTLFYSDWSRSGINQVRDLLKDDYSFLSYQEFKAKFKFTPCPLTYCGVISMLKIVKKSLGNNPTESMRHEPMSSKLENAKKASQLVYKVLVEKRDLYLPRVKKNGCRIVIVPR